MLTLRTAADLLARAATADDLAPLATLLGCAAPPAPLDGPTRQALGVPAELTGVRVAAGPGALRALIAEGGGGVSMRESVGRLAARLGARSPHLLWIALLAERDGHGVAVATWSGDRSPPRVAALLADRRRIVDSDAETVRALAAAQGSVDVMTHARWLDVLGRESLTRRFYRTLERVVGELAETAGGGAPDEVRHELALLGVSRLLFLSFLEAKGWLDGDRAFLANRFAACVEREGGFHRRVLHPLFFGTLNTPVRARAPAARALGRIPFLNGGLFSRTALEKRWRGTLFTDERLGRVLGDLLGRYRFTAREDRATWSEAAVDPEMLGRAFESLMASRERQASGSYYTPHALVEHVTAEALARGLAGTEAGEDVVRRALGGEAIGGSSGAALRERAIGLALLDPACGSGAFLVHALERLAALLARLGDPRPTPALRRAVLARSIFGVDVNPTAVWLCELRLWLSVVIEDDDAAAVPPLPNLDRHVRVGDALAGGAFEPLASAAAGRLVARLRGRYVRAVGARKRTLARALDREERRRALEALDREIARAAGERRELLAQARARDLFGVRRPPSAADRARAAELRATIRQLRARRGALAGGAALPFSFAVHFADVAARGFDVVVGNPPWVRLHRIPRPMRESLRRDFRAFRDAAWEPGAAAAGAGKGFAAQVDLAALFAERSLTLLAEGGTMALLLPAKLWRSLAGGGLRGLLARSGDVLALEDWSASRPAFDAAVYPSLLVARKRVSRQAEDELGELAGPVAAAVPRPPVAAAVHHDDLALRWPVDAGALALDPCPGSPWLLVPPEVRTAFDRLRARGVPLARSEIGRPLLGVKCGCNEAFVVRLADDDLARGFPLARVAAGSLEPTLERALLRPLVRGETVERWRLAPGAERILWTHDASGAPLDRLPPHAARWLARWRRRLAGRADDRGGDRWWTLFRTESADASAPRVVWCDVGRAPRAAVLPAGDPTVPLNSCYVARCREPEDALALCALLNSAVAAAWLHVLAEPARGGYHRYLGWTMALLPLPRDWTRARRILAPVAERAAAGEAPSAGELAELVMRAYGVRSVDVAPLLEWAAR